MSKNNKAAVLFSWVKQIALVVLLTLFISTMVIQTYDISDVSMQPTFDPRGNRVMVFLTPYILGAAPDHGDIVIIDSRVDRERTYLDRFNESPVISILFRETDEHLWVKRVIGLPGDRVELKNGKIYRNGEELTEEYITGRMNNGFDPVEIPEGHIYVLGDNRNRSSDSRHIGPVPVNNIQGRVILRFFPFNKIKTY